MSEPSPKGPLQRTPLYSRHVDAGAKIVQFAGFLANGTRFDAGELDFRLGIGQVIPGFDEGIIGMQVGGVRKLVIPPELGYRDIGSGVIPPNAILVFDVELLALN